MSKFSKTRPDQGMMDGGYSGHPVTSLEIQHHPLSSLPHYSGTQDQHLTPPEGARLVGAGLLAGGQCLHPEVLQGAEQAFLQHRPLPSPASSVLSQGGKASLLSPELP